MQTCDDTEKYMCGTGTGARVWLPGWAGGRGFLIEMLAVERQAHAAEQQARVAVVGRGRVDDDVDAGDHLRGIAIS